MQEDSGPAESQGVAQAAFDVDGCHADAGVLTGTDRCAHPGRLAERRFRRQIVLVRVGLVRRRVARVLHPPHEQTDREIGIRFRRERSFRRSEEHTSELQSLMRISYAVFCLKKKKTNTNKPRVNTPTTIESTK